MGEKGSEAKPGWAYICLSYFIFLTEFNSFVIRLLNNCVYVIMLNVDNICSKAQVPCQFVYKYVTYFKGSIKLKSGHLTDLLTRGVFIKFIN